ncbi:amidase [Candidatus Liberibacter solanacearum]|uniref:L,D-transpeptidase family protein n=1 Tax=Candidatus Liberibacter solanacearum TaxID=556287 RepID=UPI000506C8A9|nr:L,D-transpeptidase family protein [Candidatus Liberibacter solanacearum]KGB27422.1 amidase [Candidatus Liberibacter solanacearum]KJZ81140.1 amidase [Candidatus Liberibacter solanacearum]KQC49252.1 amidase [Candidatus Liberibacter solanacearum]
MISYLNIINILHRFFTYLILLMGLFLVKYPVRADILDEITKESYHANVDNRFDTFLSRPDIGIDSDAAIVSNETITNTEKAIVFYQDIVSRGGWQQLANRPLRLGDSSVLVQKLRERLIISGDLDSSKGFSSVFDSYVESAVKFFQARHGLFPDGVVDIATLKAINVPADLRLRQLRVNLLRISNLLKSKMGSRYVLINIPSASMEAVENDKVALRSVAIVGRIDRQTPILHSKIDRIMLNPYWVIPRSIIKKDLVELVREYPEYLKESNIHIINDKGKEVLPEDVDWNSADLPHFIFRQDSGKNNAMASTKIEFYSQNNSYMHDTPEPFLFSNTVRFETSGCVRVKNIIDLNVWLLKNMPGWSRHDIEEVIKTRKTTPVKLDMEVLIHFVYISAWSTKDLVVQFRDDVYGLDNVYINSIPLPGKYSVNST